MHIPYNACRLREGDSLRDITFTEMVLPVLTSTGLQRGNVAITKLEQVDTVPHLTAKGKLKARKIQADLGNPRKKFAQILRETKAF